MVYTQLNRILLGQGDVTIMLSMAGTKASPQAALIFQNSEPAEIGRIHINEESDEIKKTPYNPQKDMVMLFSKPESIDCMILALQTIKEKTFGENNQVNKYLSVPNPM